MLVLAAPVAGSPKSHAVDRIDSLDTGQADREEATGVNVTEPQLTEGVDAKVNETGASVYCTKPPHWLGRVRPHEAVPIDCCCREKPQAAPARSGLLITLREGLEVQ